MSKSKRVSAVVCSAVCLVAGHAFASEVPSQYPTIQAALDAGTYGTINVAPGVYYENLVIRTTSKVTIKGTGGAAATIIDGGGIAPVITLANANMAGEVRDIPVTVSGFTLQNGNSATTGGAATVGTYQGLAVTDCIIRGNRAASGGAFAVTSGTGILSLRNSLVADNSAINAGGALYALAGKTYLTNDTIASNTAPDGASVNQGYGAGVEGYNNIIFGNKLPDGSAGLPVFNGPTTATVCSSIIEGGFAAPTCYYNKNVDPGFVDAAAGNYQITASSPALDIAVNNYVLNTATPTIDVMGVLRPQGKASDYGAFEFVYPTVDGVCGAANGGSFILAPTADLCSVGTASVVSGTGPYTWNCTGTISGIVAACSAEHQNTGDSTPPVATSIVPNSTEFKITFSEPVTKTAGVSQVKVDTKFVTVSVAGNLMSVRMPTEEHIRPGVQYLLTVPAGTVVDASGNPNALISTTVTGPLNGACGVSNGGTFPVAPAVDLCMSGTASAVTGIGPFNWTCAGNYGGSTASCSAVKGADTTRPSVISADVTYGASIADVVFTVYFSESVTKAKPLDSVIKIGDAKTTSTVAGTTVAIKVNSDSLKKIRSGRTYKLVIPAGSFKDAAGNASVKYESLILF